MVSAAPFFINIPEQLFVQPTTSRLPDNSSCSLTAKQSTRDITHIAQSLWNLIPCETPEETTILDPKNVNYSRHLASTVKTTQPFLPPFSFAYSPRRRRSALQLKHGARIPRELRRVRSWGVAGSQGLESGNERRQLSLSVSKSERSAEALSNIKHLMYTSPRFTIDARDKHMDIVEENFWKDRTPQTKTLNGQISSDNLADVLRDFGKFETIDSAYLSFSTKKSVSEKYTTNSSSGKKKRLYNYKNVEGQRGSELHYFLPSTSPWSVQPDTRIAADDESHCFSKTEKMSERFSGVSDARSGDHYSCLTAFPEHAIIGYSSMDNSILKSKKNNPESSIPGNRNVAAPYSGMDDISDFTADVPLDGFLTSSPKPATICPQLAMQTSSAPEGPSKTTAAQVTARLPGPGASQSEKNQTDIHAKESHSSPTCAYEAASKKSCITSNGWRFPESSPHELVTRKSSTPAVLSTQPANGSKKLCDDGYCWLSQEPELGKQCLTNSTVPLLQNTCKPVSLECPTASGCIPRCAVSRGSPIAAATLTSIEVPENSCDKSIAPNLQIGCTPGGGKSTYQYSGISGMEASSESEKSNWVRNAYEKRLHKVSNPPALESGLQCEKLNNCQQYPATLPQFSKFLNGNGLNLSLFKVSPCHNDSPTHDRKNCPYYHSLRDRRRYPVLYKAEQCENHFDLETETNRLACFRGDSCDKCHNRQELLYHPDIYKQRFCSSYNYLECHRGQFCAFAHTRDEIRCPLFKRHEELAPDMTFFMLRFKTLWCPYGIQHDWHGCLYAHTFQDCRRSPEIGYGSEPCPYWQKDLHSADYAKRCPLSAQCPFSHGSKEQLYHPVYYKTMPCADFKAKRSCPRGRLCAFYHDARERRTAQPSLGGSEIYTSELNSGKDRQISGLLKSIPEHQMVFLQANFMCPPLFNLDDFEAFGHASRTSSGVLGVVSESLNVPPTQTTSVAPALGALRRQKTVPLTSTCKTEEWYGKVKEHRRHSVYVWHNKQKAGYGSAALSEALSHEEKDNKASILYCSEPGWPETHSNQHGETEAVNQKASPLVISYQDTCSLPRSSSWANAHPELCARAADALEARRTSDTRVAPQRKETGTGGSFASMVQRQCPTVEPFSMSFEWLESDVDGRVSPAYSSSGPDPSICVIEADRFGADYLSTKTDMGLKGSESFEYYASQNSLRSTNPLQDELFKNKRRDTGRSYCDATCNSAKVHFKEDGISDNGKSQIRAARQSPSYVGLYRNNATCMGRASGVSHEAKLRDDQYSCFGGPKAFDGSSDCQKRWSENTWEEYFNERHITRRATLHSLTPFYSTYTKSNDPASVSSCDNARRSSTTTVSAKASCDARQSPLSRTSSSSTPLNGFVEQHKISRRSYDSSNWEMNNENSVSTDGEAEWSVVPGSSLQGLPLPSQFPAALRLARTGSDVAGCGLSMCDLEKIFLPDRNDPLSRRDSGLAERLCGFALDPSVDRDYRELETIQDKLKERTHQRRHTVASSANASHLGNVDTCLAKSGSSKFPMISVDITSYNWTPRQAASDMHDPDPPRRSHRRMSAPTVVVGGPMGWLDPPAASMDMVPSAVSSDMLSDVRYSQTAEPCRSEGLWDPKNMEVLENGDERERRVASFCDMSSPADSCSWSSPVSRVCRRLRRATLSPEASPVRCTSSLSPLEVSFCGMAENEFTRTEGDSSAFP